MGESMRQSAFSGYALRGELDLNRLATRLDISRRYRWEEPMLLAPTALRPPAADSGQDPLVYLYYFGALVFVDCPPETIREFCRRISAVSDAFQDVTTPRFSDEYTLHIRSGSTMFVNNDSATLPAYSPVFRDIISFVIAKSVALERIEERLDQVFDEIESFLTRLEQGWLTITDKRLARMASSILSFKYASLAHVMVLDKPDSTWDSEQADQLYLTLANIFELSQRYSEIRHKSETLLDITQVFTSLSHARRASRLEWTIIILIFIEIVIFLYEIMK